MMIRMMMMMRMMIAVMVCFNVDSGDNEIVDDGDGGNDVTDSGDVIALFVSLSLFTTQINSSYQCLI